MSIIIPGGPINGRLRETQAFTAEEMSVLARMHAICQKHNIGLFCPRCYNQFQGNNTGHERYMSVSCKCRELRADMGATNGTKQ